MLKKNERIDTLIREKMKIIQSNETFNFSVDALLLANFAQVTKRTNRIADLCSGNGIIPLLLSYKTNKPITGVEIQNKLTDMAKRSILMNKKNNQIKMIQLDLKDITQYFKHSSYNMITVNPPYFKNNQPTAKISHLEMARHEISIDLEGVIKSARFLIDNKGKFYIVHRAERIHELIELLHQYDFTVSKLQFVYSKLQNDTAHFVLVESIFHSNALVKVLQPLYIYNSDGNYTEEMKEIYYG